MPRKNTTPPPTPPAETSISKWFLPTRRKRPIGCLLTAQNALNEGVRECDFGSYHVRWTGWYLQQREEEVEEEEEEGEKRGEEKISGTEQTGKSSMITLMLNKATGTPPPPERRPVFCHVRGTVHIRLC